MLAITDARRRRRRSRGRIWWIDDEGRPPAWFRAALIVGLAIGGWAMVLGAVAWVASLGFR
jgi:hypothetical protein